MQRPMSPSTGSDISIQNNVAQSLSKAAVDKPGKFIAQWFIEILNLRI